MIHISYDVFESCLVFQVHCPLKKAQYLDFVAFEFIPLHKLIINLF